MVVTNKVRGLGFGISATPVASHHHHPLRTTSTSYLSLEVTDLWDEDRICAVCSVQLQRTCLKTEVWTLLLFLSSVVFPDIWTLWKQNLPSLQAGHWETLQGHPSLPSPLNSQRWRANPFVASEGPVVPLVGGPRCLKSEPCRWWMTAASGSFLLPRWQSDIQIFFYH